jgi:hypothetical protein
MLYRHCFSALLYNILLRRSKNTKDLEGTRQLQAYADDVNLKGDNIDTIKEKKETLIDASKDVCLEVRSEKN